MHALYLLYFCQCFHGNVILMVHINLECYWKESLVNAFPRFLHSIMQGIKNKEIRINSGHRKSYVIINLEYISIFKGMIRKVKYISV